MNEPVLPAFPGLTTFGDDAAGFCADGACEVPDDAASAPARTAPEGHGTNGTSHPVPDA